MGKHRSYDVSNWIGTNDTPEGDQRHTVAGYSQRIVFNGMDVIQGRNAADRKLVSDTIAVGCGPARLKRHGCGRTGCEAR